MAPHVITIRVEIPDKEFQDLLQRGDTLEAFDAYARKTLPMVVADIPGATVTVKITHPSPDAPAPSAASPSAEVIDQPSLRMRAAEYRESRGLPKDSFVLFSGGLTIGWRTKLDAPEEYIPGVIALDVDGREYRTAGGNHSRGAERWEEVK